MLIAHIVLFSYPVVVAILFSTCSKQVAFLATIIAGFLFLPTLISVDVPMLPSLDKASIPALAAFIIILLMGPNQDKTILPGWLPREPLLIFFLLSLFVGVFIAVLKNGDALYYGPVVIPALRLWDGLSTTLTTLTMLLPFFLGRKLLAHPQHQRLILVSLVIAGTVYSFLALYEVRMSPQLNNMVYGFFPTSWLQAIRGDGYRPLVFLIHGLMLGIFFTITILAAFGLVRTSGRSQKLIFFFLGLWLLMTLVLSKSLGALAITLILIPAMLFLNTRLQLMMAAILSVIILVYPVLRGADMIPIDRIMEWAESVSADRARSLNFRLENEDLLLERARERAIFGWGGWARGQIFNDTGSNISVAEGYWVIIFGEGGWVRYFSEFALLCLPIMLIFFRSRRIAPGFETSVLSLVLVANLIDLIPNSGLTPLTWLIAGSLWGRLELGRIQTTAEPDTETPPIVRSRYSRFPTHPGPAVQNSIKPRAVNRKEHTAPLTKPDLKPPVSPTKPF